MARQYLPSWLSPRCFLVALLLTALVLVYRTAERTGFSTEGIAGWLIGTAAGGVIWGAACTYAMRRFNKKP
jgi:hypothetical protein